MGTTPMGNYSPFPDEPEVKRLTFWDYTHMPITELVKHPDYSLARFTRVMEALGEARTIIERHEERFIS